MIGDVLLILYTARASKYRALKIKVFSFPENEAASLPLPSANEIEIHTYTNWWTASM